MSVRAEQHLEDCSPGMRPTHVDIAERVARCRATAQGFVWVRLDEPTQDEVTSVQQALEIHPLAAEDAVAGRQRPKLEMYEGSLVVVLRTLSYVEETSDVETGEVLVLLGDRWVVTVGRGDSGAVDAARRRLDAGDCLPLEHGPVAVLHAVMDVVVDTYGVIADDLDEDLVQLERTVFTPGSQRDDGVDTSTRVYELKREVLEFQRAARPLQEPSRRLAEDELALVPHPAQVFLRDVADHVVRVAERAATNDSLLTDILSAHLSQVSLQQNEDARKISAYAAMAAVPTLVAGVYGMNFEWMPELEWHWGYPAALLLMAALCFALYRAFKRSGWI